MSRQEMDRLLAYYRANPDGDEEAWVGKPDPIQQLRMGKALAKTDPDGASRFQLREAINASQPGYAGAATVAFEKAFPLCESPIEKLIMPWLVVQEYSCFNYSPCVLLPGEQSHYVPYTVAVIPQLPIGGYRADFALAASRGGPVRFLVVECDGAEYHNGPKLVRRDIDRDVRITAHGRVLDVIRLTGAEIFDNPAHAAKRVERYFIDCWSRKRTDLDHKFGK